MATKGIRKRDTRPREVKYASISPSSRELIRTFLTSYTGDTANVYESSLIKFFSFIDKEISEVTKDDIDNFVDNAKKVISLKTINRDLSAIRNLIKYCLEEGMPVEPSLKDYKDLPVEKEEEILVGKSLTYEQLVMASEILKNPETIREMEYSIIWYLIFEKELKNHVLIECCTEQYFPSEYKFVTSFGDVVLDEKHGVLMNKLLAERGKDFGFTKHISDRIIRELGSILGIKELSYRDIIATKKEYSIKCPVCEKTYENRGDLWVLLSGRIVCVGCSEKLKKKMTVQESPLNKGEVEVNKAVHPLLEDNFDSARRKIQVTIEDLYKLNEFQRKVGSLGERFVLDREIEKLKDTGYYPKYIGEADVTAGYDIISYERTGEEIYIEVKSSVNFGSPFYLSDNEYQVAKRLGNKYFIYHVENVLGKNSSEVVLTVYKNPVNDSRLSFHTNDWKVIKSK
jgi:hypothetical protein